MRREKIRSGQQVVWRTPGAPRKGRVIYAGPPVDAVRVGRHGQHIGALGTYKPRWWSSRGDFQDFLAAVRLHKQRFHAVPDGVVLCCDGFFYAPDPADLELDE